VPSGVTRSNDAPRARAARSRGRDVERRPRVAAAGSGSRRDGRRRRPRTRTACRSAGSTSSRRVLERRPRLRGSSRPNVTLPGRSARSPTCGSSALTTSASRPAAPHGLAPALGDLLELAVAVELVAEEVAEADRARPDPRGDVREARLVDLEQPELGAAARAGWRRRRRRGSRRSCCARAGRGPRIAATSEPSSSCRSSPRPRPSRAEAGPPGSKLRPGRLWRAPCPEWWFHRLVRPDAKGARRAWQPPFRAQVAFGSV
jgi:hypothetical protein